MPKRWTGSKPLSAKKDSLGGNNEMSKTEVKWTLFGMAALLMNVAVPYAFLRGRETLGGAFLFWCVVTMMVIGAGVAVMSRWGERGDASCR